MSPNSYINEIFSFRTNEIGELPIFVNAIYILLANIILTGKDHLENELIDKDLLEPLQLAFEELKGEFEKMAVRIMEIDETKLQAYGLTGKQLELKFSIISKRFERFKLRGGKALFKKLIDAIDVLLDSLCNAIMFGCAITEFKKSVTNSID